MSLQSSIACSPYPDDGVLLGEIQTDMYSSTLYLDRSVCQTWASIKVSRNASYYSACRFMPVSKQYARGNHSLSSPKHAIVSHVLQQDQKRSGLIFIKARPVLAGEVRLAISSFFELVPARQDIAKSTERRLLSPRASHGHSRLTSVKRN